MAKMGNKMVALCSAAIGILYTAGYFVTDTAGADAVQKNVQAVASSSMQPQQGEQQAQGGRQGKHRHRDGQAGQWGHDGQWGQGNNGANQQEQTPPAPSGNASSGQSTAPAASSGQVKYKDGTYTGSGSNRIGSVEVAVTIKSNKITDVKITNCDTHYSESYIDDLPQEVVQRQSENVDVVSGATKSTEDFQNAVHEALQQAMQAEQG